MFPFSSFRLPRTIAPCTKAPPRKLQQSNSSPNIQSILTRPPQVRISIHHPQLPIPHGSWVQPDSPSLSLNSLAYSPHIHFRHPPSSPTGENHQNPGYAPTLTCYPLEPPCRGPPLALSTHCLGTAVPQREALLSLSTCVPSALSHHIGKHLPFLQAVSPILHSQSQEFQPGNPNIQTVPPTSRPYQYDPHWSRNPFFTHKSPFFMGPGSSQTCPHQIPVQVHSPHVHLQPPPSILGEVEPESRTCSHSHLHSPEISLPWTDAGFYNKNCKSTHDLQRS